VQKLVETLRHKLGIYTENATSVNDPEVTESWRKICSLEAECVLFVPIFLQHIQFAHILARLCTRRELKGESYGVELLHAIGFVYTAKAKQFLATNQSFLGVGGWLHNVQGKYHVFSETYVTTILSVSHGLSLISALQSVNSTLCN
jgi:hypothetical protein